MNDERPAGETRGPEGPPRRLGILTTDDRLVVGSWDAALASMTGIAAADAVGRPLTAVVPDLEARGLLGILRETLVTGAPTVLAPAFHRYLIPAPAPIPSTRYDRMQQRVAVAALVEDGRASGLIVTIEDVTERLELEHQLGAELRAADSTGRLRAIERLAGLNPVEGLGPLPTAMADEDWQVRRSAVKALAGRRDPGLIDALVSALREGHRNFSVLSSALQLLSMTGVDLTSSLVDLMQHPDPDLRIQAALALGTQTRPEAVDALLLALDDEDVNVRFHAIEALGKLSPAAAVERLAAIAESHDFFLAFPALDALSRINDPAVASRLVPLLQDEMVGGQAAEALGQIGDEEAIPPLAAALDRPQGSPSSIVDALTGIHRRYADMFSGGAAHIEDQVRAAISPRGAQRLIEAATRASGASLRQFVTVLGWLRGAAVERALAHMVGTPGAQGELLEAIVRFGAPMVDRLIEQLGSEEIETRRAAAIALGRIGDRRAVEPLVARLDEDDRDLLVVAAGALARLGDRRAFEPLLALIGDTDLAVRQAAIGALNSIGHPEMGARMRASLEDGDPRVRESAVKITGYFGYASCVEALLDRCRDTDETVRAAALEHIAYLDDARGVPLLIAALANDTPRARAAAAQALAHADGPAVLDSLRRAIGDPDPWVRYFSVTSLGRLADRASLPRLERIAAEDPAPQVRIAAVGAIGDIGVASDSGAVTMLATFGEAIDDDLAIAALRALGSVRTPAALEALRRGLSAADPGRRAAAAEAIARHGEAPAIELLRWIAAADRDPVIVRAAIGGLSRIAASAAPHAREAIAAIAELAGDPVRRADAIAALAQVPEAAIPRVAEALSSRDRSVRRAVVEALGRLAHPAASAYLVGALADGDASVRQLAVTVLSRLGTRGIARSFAALAATDPSEAVRRAAELALRRIRKGEGDAITPPDPR
jgi:HEAT repeat protein